MGGATLQFALPQTGSRRGFERRPLIPAGV
jgi:hypothetical protein